MSKFGEAGDHTTHRDVDDTPNTALAILFKYFADVMRIREVARVRIDLCAVPVLLRGIGREATLRDLRNTGKGFGVGVVMVVDGDDLEAAGLEQGVHDVRSCSGSDGMSTGWKTKRFVARTDVTCASGNEHALGVIEYDGRRGCTRRTRRDDSCVVFIRGVVDG